MGEIDAELLGHLTVEFAQLEFQRHPTVPLVLLDHCPGWPRPRSPASRP